MATSTSGSAAAAANRAEDFVDENEVLDFGTVGRESAMSSHAATKLWNAVYRDLAANSESDRKSVRKAVFMWVYMNSTSGRADLTSEVTVLGKRIPMRKIINDRCIPSDKFRQFCRSPNNTAELEAIGRHPSATVPLREIARRKGVKPEHYIVVCDVAEGFNLSLPEREELNRVKRDTLLASAPVQAPTVDKVASGNDGGEAAPKPTGFMERHG